MTESESMNSMSEAGLSERSPEVGAQQMPTAGDVAALLPRRLISAKNHVPLTTAAQLMSREKIGVLIIVGPDGKFSGILSERDIVKSFGAFGMRAVEMSVGDVATKSVKACSRATPLETVLKVMKEGGFRHMPVVAEGRVEGLISLSDVLRFFATMSDAMAEQHNWIRIIQPA